MEGPFCISILILRFLRNNVMCYKSKSINKDYFAAVSLGSFANFGGFGKFPFS